jgi:hypothetical protein
VESITLAKSLILYSTGACHLCERAEALLRSMPELRSVPVEVIDIANDAALFERYARFIPVLASRSGATLAWPFNAEDILEFTR